MARLATALLIAGAALVAGCRGGAHDSGRPGKELFLTYCSAMPSIREKPWTG